MIVSHSQRVDRIDVRALNAVEGDYGNRKKARRLSLLAIPSNYWLDLIATLHIYRSAKLIRIKKQKLIKARKLAQLDQSA